MTSDIIQHASISGELAPNLWGRTDFEKYDSAWARAQNWIVDYRGGLFTRPGSVFGDIIDWSAGEGIKAFRFQFSPDTANSYIVLFGDDYIRFIQDNAYVLEDDINIASLANDSGDRVEFTSTSHGLSDDDWVKLSGFSVNTSLNGRTAIVDNAATNTFTLVDPITGDDIEIASVTTDTGVVNRIYTVTSPYGQEDLSALRGVQIRDTLRLTHPSYPIKNLTRTAHTSWAIADEAIGVSIGTVTTLALEASGGDDDNSVVYQVTAVDENGEEGLPDIVLIINQEQFDDNQDITRIDWGFVSGAAFYNVYRSRRVLSSTGAQVFSDMECGYVGKAVGNTFSDPGITPDFARQPPNDYNPFANGRIRYVTGSGTPTGYSYDDTVTYPAGGSGAYIWPVTDGTSSGSAITGFVVKDGGQDYTGTTITVSGGSGGTFTAVLSPSSGNNPHAVAIFQQRCVYGATNNEPLRLFGSRVGFFSNFAYTDIGADDDSYEFDLDAEDVAPIRHLVPVRGGLLALNQTGVWLLYGLNQNPMTGENAQADIQTNVGASLIQPVYVDSTVTYVAQSGQEVRMLVYDDYNKVFGALNLSLLSNHLFDPAVEVDSLTYAPVPFKALFLTQDNGRLLSATIDQSNNVYAVTPHWTQGYYRYALALLEENEDRLYTFVERTINGNTVMFFERQAERDFTNIEDSFCVDAGLMLDATYPSATLIPDSITGSVTFTTTGGTPFVTGDVGKVIRCGTGRALITGYTSSSEVDATWERDLEELEPESTTPKQFAAGTWTMDSLVTSISGLWHLEGEDISVLADGEVITGHTVEDGGFTLDEAASRVVVGLGFTCVAQTLPATVGDTVIEGRRKRTAGINARLLKSAGLKYGKSLDKLYTMEDREKAFGWHSEDRLRNIMQVNVAPQGWDVDDQMYFVQDNPLPSAILSVIRDMEVGDDRS